MTEPDDAWRLIAAEQPPNWGGDLQDDCTAHWAGFMLRAEWMDKHFWWWAVYDEQTGDQVVSSNDFASEVCKSGAAARAAAEKAARALLGLK